MLPFLFVSTAYSQVYIDSTSSRYVVPGNVDDRATGNISRSTKPVPPKAPAEKKPTVQKPSFDFGRQIYLNDRALNWNGCSRNTLVTMSRGSDGGCSQDYVHPQMAQQMEKYFFKCTIEAAEDAGIPRPVKLHVNQAGVYQNRTIAGSNRMSLHALARAIDINAFILVDAEGNKTKISTHISQYNRGRTKSFYDSFRNCWKQSSRKTCPGGMSREDEGSIGHPKSERPHNWDHADHMHVSFSSCRGG
jgi:hypothetical protein